MKISTERLIILMGYHHISNKELAQRAGISAPLLSRIKARGTCNSTTAAKLASVIGWGFVEQPSPVLSDKYQENYLRAVEEFQAAQAAPDAGPPAIEGANEYRAIIQEFVLRPVPADWSRWPINSRLRFWAGKHPVVVLVDRDRICAAEVWCEALQSSLKYMSRQDVLQINKAIAKTPGWRMSAKTQRFGPYGVRRGFTRERRP